MSYRGWMVAAVLVIGGAGTARVGLGAADVASNGPDERVMLFERSLWQPTPPGQRRQFTRRPVAEQRIMTEAFFVTLRTPAEKVAFLNIGDSRYAYAIDRELYGEYAARLLGDPDIAVRTAALRGLTYNQSRQHGRVVEARLDDPDAGVRAMALVALGRFGRHDLLPRLADRVRTADDATERLGAMEAIAALLRDKGVTPEQHAAEITALAPYLAPDAPVALQHTALVAIGASADPAEAPAHIAAILRLTKATDPALRAAAITALTRFDGGQATAAIRAGLVDDAHAVRRAALRALAARADTGAAAEIARRLDDREPAVRVDAIKTTMAISDASSAAAIARCLNDRNPQVRRQAIEALEQFKSKEFVDGIAARLTDADEDVRMHAVRALGVVGTKRQAPSIAALAGDHSYPTRVWVLRALDAFDARDQRAVVETLANDPELSVTEEAKILLAKWDGRGIAK